MGDAVLKGLDLSIDTHLSGGQAGDAHLHLDKLYPTRLLCFRSHLLNLTDRSLGKVGNAELLHQYVDNLLFNRSIHNS